MPPNTSSTWVKPTLRTSEASHLVSPFSGQWAKPTPQTSFIFLSQPNHGQQSPGETTRKKHDATNVVVVLAKCFMTFLGFVIQHGYAIPVPTSSILGTTLNPFRRGYAHVAGSVTGCHPCLPKKTSLLIFYPNPTTGNITPKVNESRTCK